MTWFDLVLNGTWGQGVIKNSLDGSFPKLVVYQRSTSHMELKPNQG
jgi:hypothetical protein